MAVKKAVQSGNVEDAIEKVNDLNPEVGFPSFIYFIITFNSMHHMLPLFVVYMIHMMHA